MRRNQQLQIADCRLQIANHDSDCQSAIFDLQSAICRNGFTLIEVLTVMSVIGFVFTIIASTLLSTLKIEKAEAEAYHKMVTQHALADQFRADVAAASSAPEKLKDWVKGPACLILKTTDAGHIVYHWHDGKLERIASAGKRMDKQYLPLGDKKLAVEFAAGTGSSGLMILRLKGAIPLPAVEIAAALGGDKK